jgi:ATP-dependent DNA helicase RecG
MKKQQIFISSVQKELAAERQAIRDFIRGDALFSQYFDGFLFEDLPAADRRADETYLDEVSASAIYLGLFANDYGSTDDKGISPTEHEFDRATGGSIYRLAFIKGADDSRRDPAMKKLIGKVSQQLRRRRFETTEELLHERIYPSLVEFLRWKGILRSVAFEREPIPNLELAAIDDRKVRWFLKRAREARGYPLELDTPVDEALTHLDLLADGQLTQSAVLLFGKKPQSWLPASEVKCLHFHGTQPVKPIPDYQVFKGNLFELIDQATDFVMAKLARRVGVRDAGPENTVTYEIPKAAVTEIIINALAHRDYQSDASVQVYVFADRVGVWNPGELPPTLTPAKLKKAHSSVPRNKRLCEALFLANYIDKAGTGVLDVLAQCKAAGLPEPDFAQDGDQFTVTFWRDWLTEARLNQLDLNERQRSAIVFLKERGRISNPEYQKAANAIKKTATRDLKDLVDKGVLDQRGTRGPGVHYVLATNRDKMGTKGTFSADTPDGDKSGTKGTSAKPDKKL